MRSRSFFAAEALAASAAKQATLNISTEKVAARLSGPPRAPQISLDQTLNVTLEGPPHANSEPCGVCHDSCSGLLRFLTGGIAKTAISAAGTPRPRQSQRPGESGDRGTPGLRRRRASSRERASGLGGPRRGIGILEIAMLEPPLENKLRNPSTRSQTLECIAERVVNALVQGVS